MVNVLNRFKPDLTTKICINEDVYMFCDQGPPKLREQDQLPFGHGLPAQSTRGKFVRSSIPSVGDLGPYRLSRTPAFSQTSSTQGQ